MSEENNICVISPRMGMGDLVSFIGHFKTIYKQRKKKLIIITKKSTSASEILLNENFFNKTIYLPERKRGLLNIFSNIYDFFFLIKLLKNQPCKDIIILHSSKRYVIASKLSGKRNIYAPGYRFQKFFLNHKERIYKSFFDKSLHPRDESEELVKKIFSINTIEDNYFENKNKTNNGKYVLLGFACSGNEKQWGSENYIKILNDLVQLNFKNFCIISGKNQNEIEKNIIDSIKNFPVEIIGTSNKNVKDILDICCDGRFYFGNDTGFSHIAVSLKLPSLIIHGDLPPHDYSPYFNPILPEGNKFTKNSIQKIAYKTVKKDLINFLNKYKFID